MKDNNGDITRQHHQPSPPPPPPFSQTPEGDDHNRSVLFDQIANVSDVKRHQFPLARIKKIMKSDPEVSMVSEEAPILFSKACEMFIADLTNRAWLNDEENKRRTVQKSDISAAVASDYIYDFLLDIVSEENESAPSGSAANRSTVARPHHDSVGLPVYYPHPQAAGLVMGSPVVNCNGLYAILLSSEAGEDGEDEADSSGGGRGKLKCRLGFRVFNRFG